MIYAFKSWRTELDRLATKMCNAREQSANLKKLRPREQSMTKEAAYGLLLQQFDDIILTSFLLSALILRKMDDAAKHPFPAGKMLGSKLDRQLKKRLKDYEFDSWIGIQEGTEDKTMRKLESKEYDGRTVSNIAIHSEEMRLFDPPFSDMDGFWIRSDHEPNKQDAKHFWFLDLDDYMPMVDDFRQDPWKDL